MAFIVFAFVVVAVFLSDTRVQTSKMADAVTWKDYKVTTKQIALHILVLNKLGETFSRSIE